MGNTRDTGYLRNLVTYDASGNITLPANLTVTGVITGYATTSYVTTQINNLINGAPGLLDTLDELAAALGDDANFASTITTSIAGRQAALSGTGFVKVSGTTVSYDNSTYLTTSSASSTYLPLIGGTLSGSLSITTALGLLIQASSEATIRLNNTGGGTEWRLNSYTNGNLYFQSAAGATNAIWFSSGGAATFSSTLQNVSAIYVRASSNSDLPFVNFSNADGVYNWGRVGALLEGTGDGSLYFQTKTGGGLSTKLTITSTGTTTITAKAADADRTLPLNVLTLIAEQGNAPYGPFGGAILFKNRSYTSGLVDSARIRSVIYDDGAPNNFGGGLWFETTATPGGTLTPSLVINYQGRVGIGLTNPQSQLHINGVLTFTESGYDTARLHSISHAHSAGSNANNYIAFNVSNGFNTTSERVRINGEGYVGIGTQSPSQKLHVLGITGLPATSGTTQNGTLRLQTSGYGTVLDFGAEGPATGKQWLQVTDASNLGITYPLLLNPNGGSIGIGTSSPDQSLVINQRVTGFNQGIPATTGEIQKGILRLRPAVGTYGETLDFGMNVAPTYAWIQATNAGGLGTNYNLSLNPNGGNVGLGTTVPYTKLDVRGAISMGGGATYPLNAKMVKQGSTSVTFTATVGTIGAWRPGHVMIKVSGGQNGLQEYWAAWFFIRIIAYVGSSVICTVVDSGGDTGSVSFSSSSDANNSPQTVSFILTDGGGTTNTMIADIDLTYNEGIVSLT